MATRPNTCCSRGFQQVSVIDISPVLTQQFSERLQQYTGKGLTVFTGDFFEHSGQYHLILEQTFFCVFPPSYREQYVQKVKELLAPGGIIAGVLFNREFVSAPPFGGKIEDYKPVFEKHLRLEKMEPCYNSIKPREERNYSLLRGIFYTAGSCWLKQWKLPNPQMISVLSIPTTFLSGKHC